jgi:hypothetical protein
MSQLHAALIAFCTLLSSCANVSSDYTFDKNRATGLIVGSISYESGLGRYYLLISDATSSEPIQLGFGCKIVPCLFESINDTDFSANETPKQRGGGFAVEVPAGRYRIVGWRVAQGYINSRSKAPIDLEFVVESGKASYVGNLHFDAGWKNVKLQDKASRDLPLLQKTYAVLQETPFAYTIAPGTEISKIGGAYRKSLEGTLIFVPYAPIHR